MAIVNLQSIQQCLLQANTSYIVKNEALSNLSKLFRADASILQDPNAQSDVRSIVKLLRDFSHYHDPRVRSAALTSLVSGHLMAVDSEQLLSTLLCSSISTKAASNWTLAYTANSVIC